MTTLLDEFKAFANEWGQTLSVKALDESDGTFGAATSVVGFIQRPSKSLIEQYPRFPQERLDEADFFCFLAGDETIALRDKVTFAGSDYSVITRPLAHYERDTLTYQAMLVKKAADA